MKNKTLLLLGAALLVTAFLGFRLTRGSRTPAGARADAARDLQARVAALPKPALTNLPRTPAAAPRAAAAPASPAAARLSEGQLAPLRRAFVPPRFAADPAQPRERQTLLSNRLFVSPPARSLPSAASGRQTATARRTTPFIVQFSDSVSDASRQALADIGATVRGFFPNQALLAELTPEALARLSGVRGVHAATEYLPTDKVQPFLSMLSSAFPASSAVPMTLQTFAPEDAEAVAAAVRAAGGDVSGVSSASRWGLVRATLPLSAVPALASRGDVQWIEERPPVATQNDKAVAASHLNASAAWQALGLTGKGQLVGHADTGLDTGVTNTIHADLRDNIRAIIARGRPGDASDRNGHGTHTAGSILGSGAASAGQFRGVAWEAQLVHQSVVDSYGYFSGLPADLYELFAETYAYGACVHSDSWGSDVFGAYDADCRSADLFAWDHPDHLAVFAAGNSGRDGDANGVVDTGAICSPAAAKNVLTVGAAESDRPAGTGGYTAKTYYAFRDSYYPYTRWFPVLPISSDAISYSATPSPYRQGMAAFSSRGPTQDNRIKPEVVAPGTDVISCRSSLGGSGWGLYASNTSYCFNGGTSMATPLIAGSAALMRQYAADRVGVTNPSAALLKAMIVGGARSLAPGQYGTGSAQEIPAASPNSVEGWGQPDLSETVAPSNRLVCLLDRIGPAAGQTNRFTVTVTASNAPLDVALAWIDYPATPGALVTLVNDLDLVVVAPDGTAFLPNGGAARDALNTVETVRLAETRPGDYEIRVIGAALPYSGGAAALYVRGAIAPVLLHTPLAAQVASVPPQPVEFHVQPLGLPTNLAARLFWTTGSAAAPTGAWQSAPAVWVTNTQFSAQLPAQPPATYVHYYLEAETGSATVRLPRAAPADTFSFYVDDTVTLTIDGAPSPIGEVSPPYGTHEPIKQVPLPVSAPAVGFEAEGVRFVCSGWRGTGDVPPTGALCRAELVLGQPSSLTWLWSREFALTNRLRLADSGGTLAETVAWKPAFAAAATEAAPDVLFVDDQPYAFCDWSVDGARWPDAASASPNPATGIPMNAPRLAVGDYLPFWQDTDGDLLSDWWERRYFGSPTDDTASAAGDLDHDTWSDLAEFLDNTDPRDPASTPVPPAITVHPLDPFQPQHPPWTVQADITDNLSVEQTFLVWREKGDAVWQTNAMASAGGTRFEAPLDPPSHGAKRVDYYVLARDLLGYYAPDFAAASPLFQVIGDYAYAWLSVSPATLSLAELTAQPTNLCLSVSNLAGPDLLWTARVSEASAPFEAADGGWLHGGPNDVWCVTTNRTWNGDAVWYCGDTTKSVYPNACHAFLDTPPFRVGAAGALLWRQWIKTEPDTATHFWDGGVVRVSADGGATFTLLTPTDGYPYQITPNPASPFPFDQPCFAGNGEGWQTLLVDLAAFEGQEVIVRFEFGSDFYTVDEGWYVAGVTPLAFGPAPAPWLRLQGGWGGLLPQRWNAPLTLQADPSALAYDAEAVACVRVEGDDPNNRPLIPLTVRRGRALTASAVGPGSAAADRTFLFRGTPATLTLAADAGAYLYALTINGIPQPGSYGFETTSKVLTFANVAEDQNVQAWFDYRTWTISVATDFGEATPAVGSHTYRHGTRIDASVTSPLLLPGGLSQLACSGWVMSGHSPKMGFNSQTSFPLTNDAILVWLWKTNHWLDARAGSYGTVSPSTGWYEAGQSACVTSYPATYYHLVTWQGNTDSCQADGNLLTLPMTKPRTVIAQFAANYTATHQVPEPWLASYGFTGDLDAAAEGDSDSDGMATWQEWRTDTDPTNALSLLALTGAATTPAALQLSWIGGVARTQIVLQAASPAGPWQGIYTNLPPTPTTNTLECPAALPAGFYRIAVP